MLDGLKVLLAEDNPTNQLVATQMLENLGASVAVANDGAEALEMIEGAEFDLLLIDIEMPRVSGIELLRRLRARSDDVAKKPMIALTAYVMREHRALIDTAGADGVIAKPILSIEQFGAEIRRHMRHRSTDMGDPLAMPANGGQAEAPVIDRSVYDTLAETIGPTAMAELLEKVLADTRSAQSRLERALNPIDLDEIRTVSHILISVAGAIGARRVQDQAREINTASLAGDATSAGIGLPGLIAHIAQMLTAIEARAAS